MDDKQEVKWFRLRSYGFGWTPITWQGWATVVTYFFINIASAIVLLNRRPTSSSISWVKTLAMILILVSSTQLLIGISLSKGGIPKWQWGSKSRGGKRK